MDNILNLINKNDLNKIKMLHSNNQLKNYFKFKNKWFNKKNYIVDIAIKKNKLDIFHFLLENGYRGTNKCLEYSFKKLDYNIQNKLIKTGHCIAIKNLLNIILNCSIQSFLLIWFNRRYIITYKSAWLPEDDNTQVNNVIEFNYLINILYTQCINNKKYDLIDLLYSLGYKLTDNHFILILKNNDIKLQNRFDKYNFVLSDKIFPIFILNKSIDNIKKIIDNNNISKDSFQKAIKKATEYKRTDIINLLFNLGYVADNNILTVAIRTNEQNIIDFYIDKGYKFNKMHVKEAIKYNNLYILKILEKYGFKYKYSNKKKKLRRQWYNHYPTALEFALLNNCDINIILHIIKSNKYKIKKIKGWRYINIIQKLINNNKILIEELIKINKIHYSYIFRCVKYNNIDILKIFIDNDIRFTRNQVNKSIKICIMHKYYDMLCYLFDIGIRFTEDNLNYAILLENSVISTKIVNFILSKKIQYNTKSIINAITVNNLERLKHILKTNIDNKLEISITSRLLTLALKLNHIDISDFLIEKGLTITTRGFDYTIKNRSINYCKQIIKNVKISNRSMDYAIKRYNNLSFLKLLKKNGGNFTSIGLDYAIYKGKTNIINYLLSIKTLKNTFTSNIIKHAINNNDVELIKKLYNISKNEKQNSEILDRFDKLFLMIECIKNNNLKILKYFIDIGVTLYPELIDYSAKYGNVKILKYLISINASYTTNASNWVFEHNPNNKIEILNLLWIYHNNKNPNKEFYTDQCIDYIIYNFDINVLKFIKKINLSVPVFLMEHIVNKYNLETIKYVHNLGDPQYGYILENSLKNSFAVVKFLVDNNYKIVDYDELIYLTYDDKNYYKLKYIFDNIEINLQNNNIREWTYRMLYRNRAIRILALLLEKGFNIIIDRIENNKINNKINKILFNENSDYSKIQQIEYKFINKKSKYNNKIKIRFNYLNYNNINNNIENNNEIALIGSLD